jgi:Mg2+/Co2+ transporter CorC
MEAVYLIFFIGAACVAGLAVQAGRRGSGFPLVSTFAVALLAIVGYNSRWVGGAFPPKSAPILVALFAAGLAWVGIRSVAARWSPSWLDRRWGVSERRPPKPISRFPLGEGKGSPPGLPVTSPTFGDVSLREVMTPKTMIIGVEWEATATDAVQAASSSGHARLAVYREDLDHIAGVVHVYGLLTCPSPTRAVGEIARPPLLVPESKKCFGMLEEFLREGEQFAVVLDEFGGTAGVVTVEDLLEELVGEMADEHDREEAPVRRTSDGSYLVPGHIRVDELNERLGIAVPEGDYETVSGFVLEKLGKVPARGEKLAAGDATLEIAVSTARRIVTVKVVKNGAGGIPRRQPGLIC